MKIRVGTCVALILGAPAAGAADYTDTARVISATPIIERVTEPRQECAPASAAPQPQERSIVAPVVGGVAGAVLGSQIGRGSGKTAATAVGAIAGAVAGDRIANSQTANAQPAQACRTVETIREVVKGYTVVYRYNDRDISTTMPYNPGRTVKVGIGVLDSNYDTSAPTAGAPGSNTREVSNYGAPAYTSPPSTPPGRYDYRY